jgi:hypothetical protein
MYNIRDITSLMFTTASYVLVGTTIAVGGQLPRLMRSLPDEKIQNMFTTPSFVLVGAANATGTPEILTR